MTGDMKLEFLEAIGLGERESDELAGFGIKYDGKYPKITI